MKLSLRKANALQQVIQEGINEAFVGEVTISKFDNGNALISEATDKLTTTIDKKFNLIEVLFAIRKKVALKNSEVGVDALLTDLAENERKTAFIKQLASTKVFAPQKDVLEKALADLQKEESPATTNIYGRPQSRSLSVSLLDKKTVEGYTKSVNLLRKEKTAISDKLLHLNVSSEIELDAKEIEVLKKYDIL